MSDFKLEDAFAQLEGIADRLGDNSVPLDESFALYSKGIELLGQCASHLDLVEKQLEVISDGARIDMMEEG